MKITKRLSVILLTLIMLVSFIPMTVFAAGKNGWQKSGDYWYYYQNNQMLKKTWLNWEKNWYYFDTYGHMVSNSTYYDEADKKVYFLEKSGALTKKTGWVSQKRAAGSGSLKRWFYVKKGGVCAAGWKKISGKWYYFANTLDESYMYYGYGAMIDVPSATVDGIVYAFNNSGTLVSKTGWVSIKYGDRTYWFYVKKGGICKIGWHKDGKKWYYFQDYGPMICNASLLIEGKTYTFDKNGVCTNP